MKAERALAGVPFHLQPSSLIRHPFFDFPILFNFRQQFVDAFALFFNSVTNKIEFWYVVEV